MNNAKKFLWEDGTARTRHGRVVVGLKETVNFSGSPFVLVGMIVRDELSSQETWTAEGSYLNDGSESQLDLVLPQTEEPASLPAEYDEFYWRGDEVQERTAAVSEAQTRKSAPVVTGVLDYFPLAIMEIARCSLQGNEQHHPGTPLHWDRAKSRDEADALGRHLLERGTFDTDGIRHTTKVAWRALALLQKELEQSKQETL